MESGADNSADQDTATVTNELEEPVEKQNMTICQKEDNWPMTNKYLDNWRNPAVDGVCDEACLGLGKDPIT